MAFAWWAFLGGMALIAIGTGIFGDIASKWFNVSIRHTKSNGAGVAVVGLALAMFGGINILRDTTTGGVSPGATATAQVAGSSAGASTSPSYINDPSSVSSESLLSDSPIGPSGSATISSGALGPADFSTPANGAQVPRNGSINASGAVGALAANHTLWLLDSDDASLTADTRVAITGSTWAAVTDGPFGDSDQRTPFAMKLRLVDANAACDVWMSARLDADDSTFAPNQLGDGCTLLDATRAVTVVD